ncbi:hypothetical protein GF386_04355 [Candidatus Pacearchaeota archaeon]|nr:hypothetical protein [Candidatus Pacearchaeota archaeon]
MRKIDFIGIGAPKCATSWLNYCLFEHPEVYIPYKDIELNYFTRHKNNNWKSEYDLKGIRGFYEYFKKADKEKIIGEMSVLYLYKEIAEIIKKHFPDVKILVSLRNPIDRAFSFYKKRMNKSLSQKEYFKRYFKELANIHLNYDNNYYKQLKPYFDLFPRKNIKIIFFEDIQKNPKKSIKETYRFLGVDENFVPPSLYKRVNVSRETTHGPLEKFYIYSYKLSRSLGSYTKYFLKRNLKFDRVAPFIDRKFVGNKTLKKEKISIEPEVKKMLKKEYLPDIIKLEKLIKKDLSSWKK